MNEQVADEFDGARLDSGPKTLPGVWRYFFRHASPRIITTWFVVATGVRLWLGEYRWVDLVIMAAVVAAWPFVEWLVHVFILHRRPRKIGRFTFDLYPAWKHRRHHRHPWRLDILFFPTRSLVLALPVVVAGFWLGFEPAQAMTGVAFVGAVMLHYEFVHFLSHTRYRPKSWYYLRKWRNHRLHHCKNEAYWMGVTTELGDRLLGTLPREPADVPTSDTCRTLGYT